MKRIGMGRGKAAHTGLALLLMGCGGSGGEGPTAEEGGAVCLACQVAGGETSDFGLSVEPTPCEKSEVREALTESEARDLGFGASLDLFARSVTESFAWTPGTQVGPTATGYTPSSNVTLTTSVASVEHLVPALAGCGDRLLVHVATQLATADGALTIAGELTSIVEREPQARAFGRLDLTTASGSLRVTPPAWSTATVGYLALGVYYWPEATRGFTYIQLVQAGTDPGGDVVQGYRPLDGRFPVDSCATDALPVAPDAPLPGLGGQSATAIRNELATLLDAKQPAVASWRSGAQTNVTATLGLPTDVCSSCGLDMAGSCNAFVHYSVPLTIKSADGRVDISRVARGSGAANPEGALDNAWFEIYDNEVLTAQEFAAESGISGVSFAGAPQALWHAEIDPLGDGVDRRPRGQVTVEGVTADGAVVAEPLDELTWSLE